MMKRREFITLLGGTAAWPPATRAQQGERMRRIGVLEPLGVDDPKALARVTALAQGLQQLGWTAGRNIRIEYRWGAGDDDRIRQLVALAPDAIPTSGASTTAPTLRATRTVPVVFVTVVDPVSAGYVDSLARPGGNATLPARR
jgi:putative tryptophan/tyrosine transport system substrate-binding protein